MKISTILDQIDSGSVALPEFQRGYVWNRSQVRKLMRSLYRGYPIGGLLMWETKTERAIETGARGDGLLAEGVVKLLLDGQQRITTLYGIIRGKPPQFFEGDPSLITGLFFNLETEEFEFYGPIKMRDDPRWIDVTALMNDTEGNLMEHVFSHDFLREKSKLYVKRLNIIENIKERSLHVETVTGEDKTIDVVVEIFNEVNSGGTKLSKGDLALAKVCATWSDARSELNRLLAKWKRTGFDFKLDWLLRCVTTVTTGEAYFSALENINTTRFSEGLYLAEQHIDTVLNLIAGRLGLDHTRVLGSVYSIPLMVRYLHRRDGRLEDHTERDRLLYWYIHTLLWGRYSGSTESVLSRDLAAIEDDAGALDRLIAQLHQDRGDLTLYARDFEGWTWNARFYPMVYMMTRVWRAKDWESGLELTAHLLGKMSGLQVHHVFPKARLYDAGFSRSEVNAIANLTFLTQETNLRVSDRDPVEYLAYYADKNPGVIESHWIPMDRDLWRIENYLDFLAARRELLAQAANEFLDSLLHGDVPEMEVAAPMVERDAVAIYGGIDSDEEEEMLLECAQWVADMGLAEGELLYQLVDEQTGDVLGIIDLAWPNGLQEGLSEPVAILLNEGNDLEELVNQRGYRYFTDIKTFYTFVERNVLAIGEALP
jgi:hypothetical protein